MIKVFYSGCGYVSPIDDFWGVRRGTAIQGTHRKYNDYFCIDSKIADILEHFDSHRIDYLSFIDGNLPNGITQNMTTNNAFTFSAGGFFPLLNTGFMLRKEDDCYESDGNKLKVFWNDDDPAPQPATVSSEETPIISLLNIPTRQDEWFEVINEAVKQFHAENGLMPTATQVWNLLSTQPPTGYAITTGNDKGEICLNMAGCRLLSKSAFQERWRKYTK